METLATEEIVAGPYPRSTASPPEQTPQLKWIHLGFWCALVILGGLQFWLNRFAMNTDGISYLDIGDAIAKGHLAAAINAYWSPLYPCVLALGLAVFRPSPYWEFPTVHFVNFLILLASAGSFEFFLGQLQRSIRQGGGRKQIGEPANADVDSTGKKRQAVLLRVVGSTLFVWTSLRLVGLGVVSPDLLVTFFVYLAAGLILKMYSRPARSRDFGLLGIVLGIGYLAKTPLLPMGLVFIVAGLGVSIECVRDKAERFRLKEIAMRGAVALGALLVIAGLFIANISMAKGRFTIGDSARLNIAWNIDGVTRHHWEGKEAGLGAPIHPSKQLLANPDVFEFDGPMVATYAAWYDPSYWYEGIHPVIKLDRMVERLRANAYIFYKVFVRWELAIPMLIVLLTFLADKPSKLFSGLLHQWALIMPAVAAVLMYGVLYVEPRYLPAFVTLFWTGCFAGLDTYRDGKSKRIAEVSVSVAAAVGITILSVFPTLMAGPDWKQMLDWKPRQIQFEIAQALHRTGIQTGDKVAWIRPEVFDDEKNYGWARLAGVRIIAEVPGTSEQQFWMGGSDSQDAVVRVLGQTQARALVAKLPAQASEMGWQPLGTTGYSIILLHSQH